MEMQQLTNLLAKYLHNLGYVAVGTIDYSVNWGFVGTVYHIKNIFKESDFTYTQKLYSHGDEYYFRISVSDLQTKSSN